MTDPCCYHDPDTGRLRKLCHGSFEACGNEPRCCFCGATGHLSKDCRAERWPRAVDAVLDWILIAALSLAMAGTVAWMGRLL